MSKTNGQEKDGGAVLRNAKESAKIEQIWHVLGTAKLRRPTENYDYVQELAYLQLELMYA